MSTLPPFDPWAASRAVADVLAADRGDSGWLARRREQRLGALLESARRSRLLAPQIEGCTRLDELPVSRKTELMSRFDEWVTDPSLTLDSAQALVRDPHRIGESLNGHWLAFETSGTSGAPAIFVQDAQALAVYDALEALRRPPLSPWRRWIDPWSATERMVFLGAIGGHFASIVSIERLRRLNPWLRSTWTAISFLQPADAIHRRLEELRPTVIATYPTAAVLLAEAREQGRVEISPREVWTGGETLTPAMRRSIERGFGARVVNSYGASEFLALACECAQGRLHLNSDWAILEAVDADLRPVAPGTTSASTLLTNLANHLQPLIRYELGDRITLLPQACACGSSLPAIEVEGRHDDVLRLTRKGRFDVSLPPLALCTVVEEEAGLFDFQLVQTGRCELLLRGGRSCGDAPARLERARAALLDYLDAQGARGVRIESRADEDLVCGRSGKIKRVLAAT